MRIAYTNLYDDGSGSASTVNTLYPIANTQDQRLAKPWRSTDPSAQTVVIDLGSAQDVDTIAIIGHSFSGSAALTIQAHASDSWGAPTFATALTFSANMILKYLASAQTFRYWRFVMDDPTNTLGYLTVGRFWLGEYLTIDPSSLTDLRVTSRRTDKVTMSRGQQKYASEGVGYREFDLSFPQTENTMLESIQTMYAAVGNHSSVIFSNFDTTRAYAIVEPCYCSIVGSIAFQHARNMQFRYALKLEENK